METITGFIRRTEEDADCSWILLCSDGLHGVIDDTDLEGLLNAGGTPADIVPHLIDVALTRGTRDNVTAILVRFHGE